VNVAAVAQDSLRVCGGMSNTLGVLEAVWDSGVTVAVDEAQNEEGAGGPSTLATGHTIYL
jgi:hypothetical protein